MSSKMSSTESMRRAGLSLALLALFCGLALLVKVGALSRVDAYAVRHLMPYKIQGSGGSKESLQRLIAYPGPRFHLGAALRLPAGAAVSSLLAAIGCAVLWYQGRRSLAALWLGAFLAMNVAEAAAKLAVTRPPIYIFSHGVLTTAGFHHSFPSGHVARSMLVGAIALAAWPRLWPLVGIWVGVVASSTELDGTHTPSDIAGGFLVAAAVICAVSAAQRARRSSYLRAASAGDEAST
jgi:membrane-associated phospholipid phosphatase